MDLQAYTDQFEKTVRIDFFTEKELARNGWFHAWRPDEYSATREDDDLFSLRSRKRLKEQDRKEFIEFATKELLKADPSEDKKYFPVICRWFQSMEDYSNLQETASYLTRYEELKAQNPEIASDPYRLYHMAQRPGISRRAVKPDPIDASFAGYDLRSFIEIYEMREERAKLYGSEIIPADIEEQDILNASPEFYLYRRHEGIETIFTLSLPNGAEYELSPQSRIGKFIYTVDENRRRCMLERMVIDVPGLAEALAPIFSEQFEQGCYKNVLNFAYVLMHAEKPSSLEKGAIAESFHQEYSKRLSQCRAEAFYDIFDDISILAHFPKERELIDAELIASTLAAAAEAGAVGSVRRSLMVVNSVKHWRNNISAQHIAPVLNALSEQSTSFEGAEYEYDLSGSFDDAIVSNRTPPPMYTHKYLAQTMVFLSTTPHWRDGSEAMHLPATIDHLVHSKDWFRLKSILKCATRPDDPVSKLWRDAIPTELRNRIELSQFDNTYKAHHIDLLMKRMKDLDAGNTRMYRLSEMPRTDREAEFFNLAANRTRSARATKREILTENTLELA